MDESGFAWEVGESRRELRRSSVLSVSVSLLPLLWRVPYWDAGSRRSGKTRKEESHEQRKHVLTASLGVVVALLMSTLPRRRHRHQLYGQRVA